MKQAGAAWFNPDSFARELVRRGWPLDAANGAAWQEGREANPKAQVRVMAYATPMTHYGHIERPRQLAGALLAAVRWLMEDPSGVSPGAGS